MGLIVTSRIRAAVAGLRSKTVAVRTTMLAGVGALVLGIFACAPAPSQAPPPAPPPPAPPMPFAREQCGLSTNATPFLRNLRMLSNYNPDPNQPGGKHAPVGTSPVPEMYCTALANAYNAADRSLKDALDSLTNTFIVQNQDSCAGAEYCSWGYIDKLSGDGTHTYIGLSSALWNSDGTPKFSTYSAFAEQTVRTLLLGANFNPISIQADPDGPSLALIAALAHEMGHIKWWADGVQTSACQDSVVAGNTSFASIAWSNAQNTPAWRFFGVGDLQSINADRLTLGQFQGDVQHAS